jgi:hypothetical protein
MCGNSTRSRTGSTAISIGGGREAGVWQLPRGDVAPQERASLRTRARRSSPDALMPSAFVRAPEPSSPRPSPGEGGGVGRDRRRSQRWAGFRGFVRITMHVQDAHATRRMRQSQAYRVRARPAQDPLASQRTPSFTATARRRERRAHSPAPVSVRDRPYGRCDPPPAVGRI